MSTQPRKPAGSPGSTGGQYDSTHAGGGALPALGEPETIDAQQVNDMVRRIDAKFRPHYKYEDFAPNEPLWHLGDLGYLPADVWRNTFDHEPRWMEPAYILQGNMGDEGCEEIAETYNEEGFEGLQRMLEASSLEYVYYTEADADGDA